MSHSLAAIGSVTVVTFALLIELSGAEPAACSPSTGFEYLCGQTRPEDLARIPGTRWIVASGFDNGAGLKLVDTTARSMSAVLYGSPTDEPAPDRFPDCAPPDRQLLNVQGLSLRAASDGRYILYAVNHGERESVEVFDVNAKPDVPVLTWQGCVTLPRGLAANSVASYSDGTLLITVLVHPGNTYADFVEGRNTGGVYAWQPGQPGFELIPGTELPGNNGIETALDDSGFFVVAFGRHAILRYLRHEPTLPAVESVAPGFMPDNIHWDDGRLITAGMMYDEPACGGTRKIVDGEADAMQCHRGTVVAELDPVSMNFRVIAYAPPDPASTVLRPPSSSISSCGSAPISPIAWRSELCRGCHKAEVCTVFPGVRTGHPISDMSMLEVLRGMGKDCTVHGFRSTFRDWAADCTN